MLSSTLLLTITLTLAASASASASASAAGFKVELSHNLARRSRDPTWLLAEASKLENKYGTGARGGKTRRKKDHRKRQNGAVQLADHDLDASYSASVSFGTPAQTFNVVLDTGSSDLWVAGTSCTSSTGCDGRTTFDTAKSSSYKTSNQSFDISYGSGKASGVIAQDTISMGGYTVAAQGFAVVDTVTQSLVSTPVSGLMGLSWPGLASTGATPWWVTLAAASSSPWSQPLFAFQLARFRDVTTASSNEAQGGTATFGYLDTSLYSGDIIYISVPSNPRYWQIPISSMSIQGSSIPLSSSNVAAIDTGTTLIGGPASIVAAFYAEIPNSRKMTGSYANYYEYPCETSVDMRLKFGSFEISITDQDFNLGRFGSDQAYCTGGVYVQAMGSDAPVQWIVGATALKNTYTVFRYSPAAVGFANLAGAVTSAAAMHSTGIPSATGLTPVDSATSSSSSTSASSASTSASASASASASITASSAQAPFVTVTVDATDTAGAGASAASASASPSGAATFSARTPSILALLMGATLALCV